LAIAIAPVLAFVSVEFEIDMIILALLPVTITENGPQERNCSIDTSSYHHIIDLHTFCSCFDFAPLSWLIWQ